MKTLLAPALLAFAALVLGTTLVLTCAEPPSVPPGINRTAMEQNPGLSTPATLGLYPQPTPPLYCPGVHQTDPQSFEILPTGRSAVPSQPTPLDLDNLPPPPPPLLAGVYQTYPYTIIIIEPARGIDDRSIIGVPYTDSRMPIIKPHLEVVPKW